MLQPDLSLKLHVELHWASVFSSGRLIQVDFPHLKLFLMPLCDHVPGLGCSFWQ